MIAAVVLAIILISLFAVLNPPVTYYMWSEAKRREAPVDYQWVDAEEIAPVMMRSVVAAEDANFCLHWGFDMEAIRAAINDGATRGASTISQQVVKNLFLWHGRSWVRKALEAMLTPALEAIWSKRRILEVYLNIVEFGDGVFGIEAAARRNFNVAPDRLTPFQAASLAAVLPSPKTRSAARPTPYLRRRAAAIRAGAETIAADGRADCFEE